jgi:hypothetical protein
LSTGGTIAAASWILERIAWFQKQTADAKEWLFFGIAAVLNVGAYLALTYVPTTIIDQITPYFLILSGLFITVVVGKMFHQVDKAK